MPPHFLKDLSKSSFNNIETMSLEFVIYTLRPWLVRIEQAYNTQLILPKFQKKYFVEHSVEGLLRGDFKTRMDGYAIGIQNGWLNADEVRALENLNPQANGQGKKYHIPLNWTDKKNADQMLEMMQQKKEEKPVEIDEEEIKAFWNKPIEKRSIAERDRITNQYYPLFKRAAQEIVNKESLAVGKKVKQKLENRANADIKKWLEDFYRKQPQYIKDKIGPVFRSFAEAIQAASASEIGVDTGITGELETFIEDYTNRYAERHVDSSLGQLTALLEEGVEELQVRVDEWRERRPDKISSNETIRLSNAVFQFTAFAAGLGTIWRIRGPKTCPYCKELDGMRVVRGQSFVDNGDELNPKGGTGPMKIRGLKKAPPLHQKCDCTLIAG
jgi:hypothetical protein